MRSEEMPPLLPAGATTVEPRHRGSPLGVAEGFAERLRALARIVPSPRFERWTATMDRHPPSLDRIMSELMALFQQTRSTEAFTLLYQASWRSFLGEIRSTLRRYGSRSDPWDVLQEVYLCIYRYPHRFRPEKERAFRNWARAVVRNAVWKQLRRNARGGRAFPLSEEIPDRLVESDPLRSLERKEGERSLRRTYLLTLALYLAAYHTRLKPREKKALHLVEVEGLSYRAAATRMRIKPENFKMVVCRARKKIFNAFNTRSSPKGRYAAEEGDRVSRTPAAVRAGAI